MTARAFLPHTNSRPLMVVVIILVTLCAAQTMFSLIDLFANPNWGPLIMAALSSLLGVGLWRLHPIARGVAVLLLWVLIIVLIGGTINPFTAGDMMAAGGTAPNVWVLVAWITPAILVLLAMLHILGKYKMDFGKKSIVP